MNPPGSLDLSVRELAQAVVFDDSPQLNHREPLFLLMLLESPQGHTWEFPIVESKGATQAQSLISAIHDELKMRNFYILSNLSVQVAYDIERLSEPSDSIQKERFRMTAYGVLANSINEMDFPQAGSGIRALRWVPFAQAREYLDTPYLDAHGIIQRRLFYDVCFQSGFIKGSKIFHFPYAHIKNVERIGHQQGGPQGAYGILQAV